ncbi:MAG: RraA family protein [Gammaproteobacteria bacterium]|nr:MAG: RraA family protein [Gammaproteobacteria bacterium]
MTAQDSPRQDSPQAVETQDLVKLFEGLDTASVSDALDKIGLHGQALGIKPLRDYTDVVIGPAFTVKYVPAATPAGTVGDYIDDVKPGDVVVIDNDGRTDCTVWGDILTQYAGIHGIAGTVIDGVCRDVNKAIQDNYALFSAGRFMRTGKDRVEVETVNTTVTIGTVRVESQDIVVADANGVVFVPRKYAGEVAQTAHEIESVETAIREKIAAGDGIREAREKLGYHTLQRKQ